MTYRGEVIRKGLEAFTSAKAYYLELGKAHDYYQYLRNNVKGVSFDRQPGGGNSETKALAFDREVQEIVAEMYRLQLFLDWINQILDPLDADEEAFIREKYVEGWTWQEMAERHQMSVDQVRYRINRIIEEM